VPRVGWFLVERMILCNGTLWNDSENSMRFYHRSAQRTAMEESPMMPDCEYASRSAESEILSERTSIMGVMRGALSPRLVGCES